MAEEDQCLAVSASFIVYPKVKVREQQEDDEASLPFLDLVEYLSEKENQWDSPPIIARVSITKSNSVSASKVVKNNKSIGEERKPTSVPRPRAVLSSPDNDGKIGSRNKLRREVSAVPFKGLQLQFNVEKKTPNSVNNSQSKAFQNKCSSTIKKKKSLESVIEKKTGKNKIDAFT